ncbi:MAG: hypothetical protein M3441_15050 [Chloroflexota bacterium]|nr:hypothetical protein [Chloroflexota bacterium]
MTGYILIFLAIAGATVTSHAFLLMCYVVSCYRAWVKADGADGFLSIAGRAIVAAVAYGASAAVLAVPLFVLAGIFAFSPGLASELDIFPGLAAFAVAATYGLPFEASGGDFPIVIGVVLIAFFVLGLVTMLPGLGYGSKRLWAGFGMAAYLTYLSCYAAYVFPQIDAHQDHYIAGSILVVACVSLAAGATRLCLWTIASLPESNPSLLASPSILPPGHSL